VKLPLVTNVCQPAAALLQAIRNPEDFIAACEASWRPEVLLDDTGALADPARGIMPGSPAGAFLRQCRLTFDSMPFEVPAHRCTSSLAPPLLDDACVSASLSRRTCSEYTRVHDEQHVVPALLKCEYVYLFRSCSSAASSRVQAIVHMLTNIVGYLEVYEREAAARAAAPAADVAAAVSQHFRATTADLYPDDQLATYLSHHSDLVQQLSGARALSGTVMLLGGCFAWSCPYATCARCAWINDQVVAVCPRN
jgi:hypothetical protein